MLNQLKVLKFLQKKRESTKQEIGKVLSLSIPTVTNNLQDLMKRGIVSEQGHGESSGGRRPALYQFHPGGLFSQGIEITPHGIRSGIINLDGELIHTFQTSPVPSSTAELFSRIQGYAADGMDYADARGVALAGIGITLPGIVDPDLCYLSTAPNLHMSSIDFQALCRKIDAPVFIENEANASAIAEKVFYGSDEIGDLIYLSITEGLGAGIFLDNRLYRGRRNQAGEIGHICLVPGGKPCNCGQRGCLEQYVSEKALLEAYNSQAESGLSGLGEFLELLRHGDGTALGVWKQYIEYLALGIQHLLHTFDPSMLIIGGNLALFDEELLVPLRERITQQAGLQFHSDVMIQCSRSGGDAALIGGGLLPLEHVHL